MIVIRNMAIKDKLIAAVMLVCTLALACAGTIFIVWGQATFLETSWKNISALAEMVATNSKVALAFEDAKDADETLRALRCDPSVAFASIYTRHGRALATYNRDDTDHSSHQSNPTQSPYSSGFGDGFLTVLRVVVLDNEIIGTVRIQADIKPMFVMLKRNTTTVVVLLLIVSWGFMLLIYSSVKKNIRSIANSVNKDKRAYSFVEGER